MTSQANWPTSRHWRVLLSWLCVMTVAGCAHSRSPDPQQPCDPMGPTIVSDAHIESLMRARLEPQDARIRTIPEWHTLTHHRIPPSFDGEEAVCRSICDEPEDCKEVCDLVTRWLNALVLAIRVKWSMHSLGCPPSEDLAAASECIGVPLPEGTQIQLKRRQWTVALPVWPDQPPLLVEQRWVSHGCGHMGWSTFASWPDEK